MIKTNESTSEQKPNSRIVKHFGSNTDNADECSPQNSNDAGDSDDEAESFDVVKNRGDRKRLPIKSKNENHRSTKEACNRRPRRFQSSKSGTPGDKEPLPKHIKRFLQDDNYAVDCIWMPVRDAITAQNSDVDDGERCEKKIGSSQNVTKGRRALTSSQRQSNMEPDNDADDENYEESSKTRREESSSKKRDEKLNREKPKHSSSCKDTGRRTGSRRMSPFDKWVLDVLKEKHRRRISEKRRIRELKAKVGLEPLKISGNEGGAINDGGTQTEEAEKQYEEQLMEVPPQNSSDNGDKRRRALCKEGGTENEEGAQKVDIILYYIILYHNIHYRRFLRCSYINYFFTF